MSRDALVVGISAYQSLPGLNAPGRDAEAIAQQLQAHSDFRVTRMPDVVQSGRSQVGQRTPVTLAELEAALVRLFKPRGKNPPQTALFYFSGHGLQKDAGIQEGYLATSDANPQMGFYGLSLFWLRRLLQESPVRQRIILLDCCHSGELLNFLEADPGAKPGVDRLFMAASRDYESAYESINGEYSVFTQALLHGLDPTQSLNGTVTNYTLTDRVSYALKGEMQQPLFENSGSEIVLTRAQGCPTIAKASLATEVCPYRGLEFFDEMHAEYFFGREELTDNLIERLRSRNFVAVVGASGSGKSSLVRAGLVHTLRQGRRFSGSDRWRIQLLTPTDQPLKSLATAFINPKAPAIERAEQLRRAETFLKEGGAGLANLVRASLLSNDQPNSRLLLIIDQFEEVFTLCQGPQAERDRHRFFNSLLTAIREASDCLSVLIVLRADFFGKCSLYTDLAEHIEHNLMTVVPLTYEQIKSSIVKPAEKVGLVCEPNLVYNILLDIVGAPGELPLLQYTLLELWHRRQVDLDSKVAHLTLDAYTELGGVRGTLQKRADEIFYSLSPEEQQVAKRIFIALTQLGDGTEDTRRRILRSELISSRFPAELVDRVLEKLVNAKLVVTNRVALTSNLREHTGQGLANISTALRLTQLIQRKLPPRSSGLSLSARARLTIDDDRAAELAKAAQVPTHPLAEKPLSIAEPSRCQVTIDVAHETLIRNWSLLRHWLDESRETLHHQRRIEHAAREWQSADPLRSSEYLLRGDRLSHAEEFLEANPDDLSDLAQRFLAVSREESRRTHKEMRLLQTALPLTLLVALGVTVTQYQTALRSQAEKDFQTQVAVSRQRAAIAQSILYESEGDPTTALLISRLAVEQGGLTSEAQMSLRSALQRLNLWANLKGHRHRISRLAAQNSRKFVTAGEDGTIRLWSWQSQATEQLLSWFTPEAGPKTAAIRDIALSQDGTQIAAIAEGMTEVRIWSGTTGQLQHRLGDFSQAVTKLTLQPQGTMVAAAADTVVKLWNLNSQAETRLTYGTPVTSLTFSPDGQRLLISSGRTIDLIQPQNGKRLRQLQHPVPVTEAQFSPDGAWIAAAGTDGKVYLWQTATGQLRKSLAQDFPIQQILFSPSSRTLAVLGSNGTVRLWDAAAQQLQANIALPDPEAPKISEIAFSPDSRYLASVSSSSSSETRFSGVSIWDARSGKRTRHLYGQSASISAVQFIAEGALIATGSADGAVQLWLPEPTGELPTLTRMGEKAPGPVFWQPSGDGTTSALVTIAQDGSLQRQIPLGAGLLTADAPDTSEAAVERLPHPLSRLVSGMPHLFSSQITRRPFLEQIESSASVSISPAIAAAHHSRQALPSSNQETAGSRMIQKLPAPAEASGVAFNPNRRTFAIATASGGLELWRVQTDQSLQPLRSVEVPNARAARRPLRQVHFSQNGERLVAVSVDRAIQVWDAESGKHLASLYGHPAPIESVHLSADGQRLVSVDQSGEIRLWQLSDRATALVLRSPSKGSLVRLSPDGMLLAIANPDGTAHLLDATTGALRVILTGHQEAILDIQFSPSGTMLMTAGADGTTRLWSAETGVEWATLRPTQGESPQPVRQAIFSPDGNLVATVDAIGNTRVWVATWGGLLKLARDRSPRQLTAKECLQYLGLPPNACPAL